MNDQAMKVSGIIQKDGRKYYILIWDTQLFIAKPTDGQKFECNGVTGTLKAIKEKIRSGEINNIQTKDADVDHCVPVATTTAQPTWDCIDPCALMIVDGSEISASDILHTLNCKGWLSDDGLPDVEKARREVDRFKLK